MSDQSSILELRQRQARAKLSQQTSTPVDSSQPSFFGNLIRTGAQGLSFGTGDEIEAFIRSQVGDQTYAENLDTIRSEIKSFADENPKLAIGAEIAGSIPTALAGGAGLARLGIKGAGKIAGIEGAAYGFGAGEGGAAERAKSSAISGTVSAGIGKTGDLLFPKVNEVARRLIKQGIKVTPGQRFGGNIRAAEEYAKSVPFVGDIIRDREIAGLESLNRVAVNRALGALGKGYQKIPPNVTGTEAYTLAKEQITLAYDKVLPRLALETGGKFEKELTKIVLKNKADLGDSGMAELARRLEGIFAGKGKDGVISGDSIKKLDSELGAKSNRLMTAGGGSAEVGYVLGQVQKLVQNSMKGIDKTAKQDYAKVKAAFKTFLPVERAVVKASARGGVFTPNQLASASREMDKTKRKKATAMGTAAMQDLAVDAQDVMASNIPNSGTVDRGMAAILANRFARDPITSTALGIPALASTGALYGNPFGRGLLSTAIAAPRAMSVGGAPATGSMSVPSILQQIQSMQQGPQ